MTYKITDLIAPTGQEIDSILLTVTSIGGIETVNAPTEGLSVTIGMVPGIGDNRAGRFGWVSFGKTYLGVQFWSQRQDVNYINQIFYSNIESADSVRVWLRPSVAALLLGSLSVLGSKQLAAAAQLLLPLLSAAPPVP